jgi:hypothetical protein
MRGRRPAIFLGDMVRAVRKLEATGDDVPLIAEALGLATRRAGPSSRPAERPDEPPAGEGAREVEGAVPAAEPHAEETAHSEASILRSVVPSDVSRARVEPQRWTVGVPPLPDDPEPGEGKPLPFEPLLVPHWTRGILTGVLSTLSKEGSLDEDRVVQALAERRPLRELPRLPLPTMRRGAQLLIDRGEGMVPFLADADWMVESIRLVVGAERLEILNFAGNPEQGCGQGPAIDWEPYRPPPPATPVVLLTDLGLGRPPLSEEWAGPDEWHSFAQLVRHAGCPLVAFVPYSRERWPQQLIAAITIIPWDRTTTAGLVASAVRRSVAERFASG